MTDRKDETMLDQYVLQVERDRDYYRRMLLVACGIILFRVVWAC